MEEIITIKWTKQDIKDLLANNGRVDSDKEVDKFLEDFDIQYFEDQCIQDGWERLNCILK